MMTGNKNLSLYQLGNEYQKLLADLYDLDTGEVNKEVEQQLNELAPTTEKKCIAVASYMKRLENDKKEVESLIQELQDRLAAYKEEITKWKDYLQTNMERCQINEIKCPYFTLKLSKNPYGTDIIDEAQIPEKFMNVREVVKTEIKPNRNAIIEEFLRTGIQVPGAIVRQKTKLKISIDKL